MPPASRHLVPLVVATLIAGLWIVSSSVTARAGLDECTDAYKELAAKPKYRAMAVSEEKNMCWFHWGFSSSKLAERELLAYCRKKANDCRLLDAEQDIALLKKQQKDEREKEVADIKQAQTKLKELGLYSGKIDGKRGPGTIAAVKAFQRQIGGNETGDLGEQTLYELSRASRSQAAAKGKEICQQALNIYGLEWSSVKSQLTYVDEAKRRGLSINDCRVAIGMKVRPNGNSDPSRAAADSKEICRQALNIYGLEWSSVKSQLTSVEEAKRRGLSVDDCRAALGIDKNKVIASTDAIRLRPTEAICTSALIPTRTRFSSLAAYQPEVEEAKRRGLSVDDCRVAIGMTKLQTVPAQSNNVSGAEFQICMSALSADKTKWDNQAQFRHNVEEAKHRGLSVDDCRAAIGLLFRVAADSDMPVSPPELQETDEKSLCKQALDGSKYEWEKGYIFAGQVAEAKRRGFSVDDCRVAIGLNRIAAADAAPVPQNVKSQAPPDLCKKALNGRRDDWDVSTNDAKSVEEAKRRGLSVDDCRVAIGLAPLDATPSQAPQLVEVDPPTPKSLSLNEICEQSLNTEKTGWSNASSAADARKQANALGITIDLCRVTLGINDDQKTADTAIVSNQNAENSPPISPSTPLQKKVALVIGNSAYEHSPRLVNPHNDAEAVAKTLTALGFEVISGLDLTNAETEKKAREFARSARTADVSLLYYAGHGLQIAGENYIVPVDAKVEDETAISFELINVSTITNFMGGLDKVGIILLDACRDNPFSRSLKRSLSASRAASVDQGLAPISAEGGGLFVAFATAPGDVAADGDGMTNSPFTTALLKHLPTKGLEINTVMTRVKAEVAKMTKNDQRPWTNSDLTTEVYLAPAK